MPAWLTFLAMLASTGGRKYDQGNALQTKCRCVEGFAQCSQNHGNVEMGEHAAQQVLELDSENAAGYVLLSNIYAADGNWNLCENVQ
jgi:hypothetical protein